MVMNGLEDAERYLSARCRRDVKLPIRVQCSDREVGDGKI